MSKNEKELCKRQRERDRTQEDKLSFQSDDIKKDKDKVEQLMSGVGGSFCVPSLRPYDSDLT